ncbi:MULTISPECIES: hypothetical protein [unclassified Serratia (in: enterobacteria)]|uniref:hypothetical protein n=1 Tax=unclassified Serratia (in: enterobacteria) TaxID=2647522 RepID=UPI003B43A434
MTTPFAWDPNANQTYMSNYGSQTLQGEGRTFDKLYNRSFTMSAPGCTLTLKGDRNIPDNEVAWPRAVSSGDDITHILVQQGTLKLMDIGKANLGYLDNAGDTIVRHLDLEVASQLTVDASLVYFGQMQVTEVGKPQPQISIYNNGIFNVNAEAEIWFTSGTMLARDNASVTMSSIIISAQRNENLWGCKDVPPVFRLSAGTPSFTFKRAKSDVLVFDFLTRTYEKGLFYFDTQQGINRGKFIIEGIGNTFQYNALVNKGLVSIDGNTDLNYVDSRLKQSNYVNGNLVLELK